MIRAGSFCCHWTSVLPTSDKKSRNPEEWAMVGDFITDFIVKIGRLKVFFNESEKMGHHFWCRRYQCLWLTTELGVTEITNRMDRQCRLPCFTAMSGKKDRDVWVDVELVLYFRGRCFHVVFFYQGSLPSPDSLSRCFYKPECCKKYLGLPKRFVLKDCFLYVCLLDLLLKK